MDDVTVTRDMMFLATSFEEVVARHFQLKLAHDLPSVAKLDALFARGPLRQIAKADFRNVSVMLAAYLGETMRTLAHGGHWALDEALGPCIVNLPGVRGSVRVLARAQKRIRTTDPEVLVPLVIQVTAPRA